MRSDLDCEVAIVGAGLVGAAMALGLQRQGISVRLLDRGPAPESDDEYDLRVYAISPASVRLLQDLGVWGDIVAERACAYSHMQVWERDANQALHFDAADARTDCLGYIVESRVIQRRLLAELDPDVLQGGVTVGSLDNETGSNGAVLHLGGGGLVRARLVVAAEGARSPLREAVGIETLRHPYEHAAVVAHVRTAKPHRGSAFQRFLETGPLAFLPLADGRSSIVWSSTEAESLMALDDDAFRAALAGASQYILGEVTEVTRRLGFPLTLQHAEQYFAPRLVLMGDAAHVVHPLAGQGVNLGFGDVQALLDLIGEARNAGRDIASPRLLARYQRVRRAAVGEMIAVTDGLYRVYRLDLPGWNWLRSQGLSWVNAATPLRQSLVRRACGL